MVNIFLEGHYFIYGNRMKTKKTALVLKLSLLNMITILIISLFIGKTVLAKPLPIDVYGSLPFVSQIKLSPNGNNIAMVNNYQGTLILTTYNFSSSTKKTVLQADNIDVVLNWYVWGNDDVLLVSAAYPTRRGSVKYTSTRLYKYDLSKDNKLKLLVKPKSGRKERAAQFQDNIISMLPDKPDKILMAIDFDTPNHPSLYEVDLRKKRRKRLKGSRSYIEDWYADQQGNPRITYGRDETQIFYKLFDNQGEKVRDLWSYEIFEKEVVHILGFDLDPNILYIRALYNGRYAIFKVNLTDKKLNKELVLADEKYDVDGSLIYSPKSGKVVGLSHKSGNDNKIYWDEEYLALKRGLNKAIPDAKNTIISMSKDLNKYVLFSSSDATAGDYYFGDRNKKNLNFLASLYPKINKDNYAKKELVKYKARDGLEIEAYLTKPINATENSNKKFPAIILPHGGPMARDYDGFDYWAELFANQGYVVFQPNFRGSSGYGYEFEMAAIEGWGKAMQDDLQDATTWLIEQNIINPGKVCIGGASYGGYAALMAAVKHGKGYKCAASFAGVSDIELIVDTARKFTNKEVVEKQFGTDDDELEKVSPVNFAEEINIPILLIHGTDDRVVPVRHSRDMVEALEDYDKKVTYIEIEDADHHLSVQAHRMQTLEAMVEFFDRHLK
jgi:dipeptidyl aminopeptidase/acylaminoacyl peptidase